MKQKIVIPKIRIKKGMESEYLAFVQPYTKISSQETGILTYSIFQSLDAPNEFMAYEIYANQEAFDLHCKTDHFKNFLKETEHLYEEEIIPYYF